MIYSTLGRTGIQVSRIALGAGPIPATMIDDDLTAQQELLRAAIEAGINWFDTAAGYGEGRSEAAIGSALESLGHGEAVHIATKVRVTEADLNDISSSVRASVEASLGRLRCEQVTLLQLHNSITAGRGDEPTSITPPDVLGPGGILQAFEELRQAGLVRFIGLTGIGQPKAMRTVIQSGAFDTIQIPFNILNPSAGMLLPAGFDETNYGNVIESCTEQNMGVFAIRVYAGGALLGHPPSGHTYKTKFFPLDLYERDVGRARSLQDMLPGTLSLQEAGLRYVLGHADVTSAIVGLSEPAHIREAVDGLNRGPLPGDVLAAVGRFHEAQCKP
jgi:L-galactose dehydrogenase/L-glyceraldehyde 3-phosphate reductase